ncbi:potassium/sodium eff [Dendrothele bispora CBS 962.96]|uniref:Potassium/sodium eff n=1 Tax=Dendrothele bispora (strain CBS 962.96) TaxID=1314807 RepID=A0A4S8MDU1_DENBC|nr:potassium/sodium eff [Dendrothele bispora CBS 962.96]
MSLFKKKTKKDGQAYTRSASQSSPDSGTEHAALSDRAYSVEGPVLVQKLKTHETDGLSEQDAKARLQEYLTLAALSAIAVLIRQMANALTLVLVAAMALSFGVQDWVEGAVITAVIVINVTVGFFQEYKAEKTMDSLRNLSSPTAIVVRNGETVCVAAKEVVPGDIVNIKIGDVVPADLRLLSVANLEIDEALLTGEALPVAKMIDPLKPQVSPSGEAADVGVGDRINMAFTSTVVTKGRGSGVVVATGMGTQVGSIAFAMGNKKNAGQIVDGEGEKLPLWKRAYEKAMLWLGLRTGTPLQIKRVISTPNWNLFPAFLFVPSQAEQARLHPLPLRCLVSNHRVFVCNGGSFHVTNEVAIYAITLSIAVIPESLIAVLTITMSAGTLRMAKQSVIVRKLNALEALGGVTDICSDKTGTLTQGKMTVRKVWMPSSLSAEAITRDFTVESSTEALSPEGRVLENVDSREIVVEPKTMDEGLRELVTVASLCNIATIGKNKEDRWTSTGDPTEVALQVFAHKLGMGKPSLVTPGSSSSSSDLSSESKVVEDPEIKKQLETIDEENKNSGDVSIPPLSSRAPRRYRLKTEYPFDSSLKRMSTVYIDKEDPEHPLLLLKGAVERVLEASVGYSGWSTPAARKVAGQKMDENSEQHMPEADVLPLDDETRTRILAVMEDIAAQGLRVLALASRRLDAKKELNKLRARDSISSELTAVDGEKKSSDPIENMLTELTRDEVEKDSVFLGLVGIYDPPRPESITAVRACNDAGITVHMLTGDHAATATAIAKEIKIVQHDAPKGAIMTATEFNKLSDAEIDALPQPPLVIVRCAPETRVRMIKAGHYRGKYLATTGDGVNDAPALSLSLSLVDLAMIMYGSGVAKDASILRFVLHLLSVNIAEVIVLVIGLAFIDNAGQSVFPLSPLAVLWINMITSCPPAFGLGLEKAAINVMDRPPHSMKSGIFTWPVVIDCFAYGLALGSASMASFVAVVWGRYDGDLGHDCNRGVNANMCEVVFRGRSTVFATMIFCILFYAWELKSLDRPLFNMTPGQPFWVDLWANQMLFWYVNVPVIIYVSGLNTQVFYQRGITWEWGVVIGMTTFFIIACELWKVLSRNESWFANIGKGKDGVSA